MSGATGATAAGGRPRVFVTRRIPDEGLDAVRAVAEVDVWSGELPPPRAELLRRVVGRDGLLALLTDRVDEELLVAAGPRLRVVSNFAVGYDNIDVAACARRGIAVGHTPGVLTETTADFAFALLMAAARRIPEGRDHVRAGAWRTWDPLALRGADVHGATLGLIGFGRIGRAVARRARGFDMTVLVPDTGHGDASGPVDEAGWDVRAVPLEVLLATSDFVSLHVDLTPRTRGLMARDAFRQMKPTAILVNTSRGPVVDPAALYEALRDGVIGGAALDVTDPEPIRPNDPLLTLPNCLIVPHMASASLVARARMAELAAANLVAGLRGEPLPAAVHPGVAARR